MEGHWKKRDRVSSRRSQIFCLSCHRSATPGTSCQSMLYEEVRARLRLAAIETQVIKATSSEIRRTWPASSRPAKRQATVEGGIIYCGILYLRINKRNRFKCLIVSRFQLGNLLDPSSVTAAFKFGFDPDLDHAIDQPIPQQVG